MTSGPITSWQIAGETIETVADFIFLVSRITADLYYSHEIKKCLLLGRKAVTNLDSVLKSSTLPQHNTGTITLHTESNYAHSHPSVPRGTGPKTPSDTKAQGHTNPLHSTLHIQEHGAHGYTGPTVLKKRINKDMLMRWD